MKKNRVCRAGAVLLIVVMLLGLIPAQVCAQTQFVDVSDYDWFAQPVSWALQNGITNGTSQTTFSPRMLCSRAEILTFLWRAAGRAEPVTFNPFFDVSQDAYFYKAAVWAYEIGLVDGVFLSGDVPCTRAEVVTYLWKLNGAPYMEPAGFTDVPATAAWSQAVAWAVACDVTNGTGASTFSPYDVCTRGQIVTFLYRAFSYDVTLPGQVEQPQEPVEQEPSYGIGPDQQTVWEIISGLEESYPEGTIWSLENSYYSEALLMDGAGCAGFALLCSDAAFGDLPVARTHSDFDAIKVGDMVRTDNGRHTVVVLEKRENSIIVTEGNYNDTVHWGREFDKDTLIYGNFVVTTRYPN